MPDNTVTLVVNGDVSLETFTQAVANFNELVQGLSEESGGAVDWLIQDLQVSSAVVASMGKGDPTRVQNIVIGYEDVATSLEKNIEIKHSPRVKEAAGKLVSIEDKRVPSLLMQTARRDAIVPTRLTLAQSPVATLTPKPQLELVAKKQLPALAPIVPAYGAIEGRIQTLTNRGGLRFTLYDLLYDKAVSCYVSEDSDSKELLRDAWGKLHRVEGLVSRDPDNGRPLSIRDIRMITPLPECGPFEYHDARGAVRPVANLSPEETIRRIRDAQ